MNVWKSFMNSLCAIQAVITAVLAILFFWDLMLIPEDVWQELDSIRNIPFYMGCFIGITGIVITLQNIFDNYFEDFCDFGDLFLKSGLEKISAVIAVMAMMLFTVYGTSVHYILKFNEVPIMGMTLSILWTFSAIACIWFSITVVNAVMENNVDE